jgi:hypothetical protein
MRLKHPGRFSVLDGETHQSYAAHGSAGEHDLAGRSWLKNLLVRALWSVRQGECQVVPNAGRKKKR